MLHSTSIDVDLSPWLSTEGVEVSLYFGDSCEPAVVVTHNLKDLIDKNLESYFAPYNNKIAEHHYKDVEDFIATLDAAALHARKRFAEMI